jgi:hypothetical protein
MNIFQVVMVIGLLILLGGLAGVIVAVSYFAGDKDNLQEVQKNLSIIAGTSSVLLLLAGIFLYVYIRVNPQAFVPAMIIMNVLSLEVALVAVSASVLQKTS